MTLIAKQASKKSNKNCLSPNHMCMVKKRGSTKLITVKCIQMQIKVIVVEV